MVVPCEYGVPAGDQSAIIPVDGYGQELQIADLCSHFFNGPTDDRLVGTPPAGATGALQIRISGKTAEGMSATANISLNIGR